MRGYQKKVIYVKNTGSRHFEEAYFVLRRDAATEVSSAEKMIDEANRIIEENFGGRRGFLYSKRWYLLAYLAGCATMLALCLAAWLIIK